MKKIAEISVANFEAFRLLRINNLKTIFKRKNTINGAAINTASGFDFTISNFRFLSKSKEVLKLVKTLLT